MYLLRGVQVYGLSFSVMLSYMWATMRTVEATYSAMQGHRLAYRPSEYTACLERQNSRWQISYTGERESRTWKHALPPSDQDTNVAVQTIIVPSGVYSEIRYI